MVIRKYLGVGRDRILALKGFRNELIAIQDNYSPFEYDFKSVHAVIQALDTMAETLLNEKDVYWKRFQIGPFNGD